MNDTWQWKNSMDEIKTPTYASYREIENTLQTNNNSDNVSIFLLHPSLPSCRSHITAAVVHRFNLLKNHFLFIIVSPFSTTKSPRRRTVIWIYQTLQGNYTVAVMVLL
jgi:hypothetical protein